MIKTIGQLILGFVAISAIVFSILFNWFIFTITVISILGLTYLYFHFVRRKRRKRKVLNRCGREYHSMCKAQRYLSSKAENYEKENKKLKFDKRHWEELEINLNNTFDEASERFQFELQQKDHHIVHLTRRIAKLESAETAWKVNLDFEKDKVRRLKRDCEERISNLERIKDAEIASLRERLNDTETKLEDEMKSRLVVEELNHQLRSQLKEVPIFKKDLPLLPVFPRSPWTSSIYYDGIQDSLNNNTSDLSNGYGLNIDEVPPSFTDVEYMDIVAENYKLQDIQKQCIVASDSIDKTDYYDRCQLSSDSANPLETIPSSLHVFFRIGAGHVP